MVLKDYLYIIICNTSNIFNPHLGLKLNFTGLQFILKISIAS